MNSTNGPDFQAVSLRPIFPNYCRDLPPDVARRAIFTIDIRPAEDARPDHERGVAGCEGGACATRDGARP